MAAEQKVSKKEERIWAAAGYLWILSLVVLAARKKSTYVRFHASQGLLIFILSIVFLITGPLVMILNLILAVLALTGIYKAWQGQKWELPIVGGFAKKIGDAVIKTLKI